MKKTEVKLELPIDIDMLFMVEKMSRRLSRIYHSINGCLAANNKYMKDFDNNEQSSYLKHWDLNKLYGWAMLQKLPINGFE